MASYSDINPFNMFSGNSSTDPQYDHPPEDPSKPKVRLNPNDFYYDMTGEKYLVIFNHEKFDPGSPNYYRDPPKKRIGTEEDVTRLTETFETIGFKVDVHNDKTQSVIMDILRKLRETNYSAASCLSIVFLTHGLKNGGLCAYDRPFYFDDVIKIFESHPTLAGKPKLFFVQACRGNKMDDGNTVAIDGELKETFVVPSRADFLIMRSTVEDYLCYLDGRGSWMIQELCKVIKEYHEYLDVLQIITIVQKHVALGYSTYTPKEPEVNNKKQMPETTFTLTKFLKI